MVSSRFSIARTLYESNLSKIYLVETCEGNRFVLKLNTALYHAPLEHKVCTAIKSAYLTHNPLCARNSDTFQPSIPLLTGISYSFEKGTAVLIDYVKGFSLRTIMHPRVFSFLVDELKTTSDKLRLSLGLSASLQACKALAFLHKEYS
ncbi:MAG: hypothetical protein Q7K43_03110, partial [Candidatus Woesearchaeota archaeon]|nr:hypothetical protein [Candidatus Woesearchaeota archaeon]